MEAYLVCNDVAHARIFEAVVGGVEIEDFSNKANVELRLGNGMGKIKITNVGSTCYLRSFEGARIVVSVADDNRVLDFMVKRGDTIMNMSRFPAEAMIVKKVEAGDKVLSVYVYNGATSSLHSVRGVPVSEILIPYHETAKEKMQVLARFFADGDKIVILNRHSEQNRQIINLTKAFSFGI